MAKAKGLREQVQCPVAVVLLMQCSHWPVLARSSWCRCRVAYIARMFAVHAGSENTRPGRAHAAVARGHFSPGNDQHRCVGCLYSRSIASLTL
jgi:hypothetical protein